jgi:hypothetical protein
MRTKTTIEKTIKAKSIKMKSILLISVATLGITIASTAQNVPSYIPTNGLVGWWPFNGNANDESGNGNDGIVNGATLTTDRYGSTSKAYSFDGINDDILVQDSPNLNFSNQFTISAWFAPDTSTLTPNPLHLITKGIGNYAIKTAIPNRFSFGIQNVQDITITTFNSYFVSQWIHYTVVFNFPNATIYLDGINNSNGNSNFSMNSSNSDLLFGSLTSQIFSKARIDDIAIWNRALTPQEITALYTASSTNNNATSNTTANVPGSISYQAVARDAQGMPLADANLQVRFKLIADSISGAAEYEETHTLSTNSLGLFTTALGAGTPVSNTFGNINWSAGHKFLQVQIDAGNGWMDMGTQQLLSTPYSLYSAKAGEIKNPGLPVFADNAAALAGGLVAGDMYRTASGDLKIVY